MDATNRAVRRAGLFGEEFALEVGLGVLGQWHAGEAALLRAVVHQAVLADVEVARSGTAAPVVGLSVSDGFLELVEAGIIALLPVAHLEVNATFFVLERLELAVPVVDDSDC